MSFHTTTHNHTTVGFCRSECCQQTAETESCQKTHRCTILPRTIIPQPTRIDQKLLQQSVLTGKPWFLSDFCRSNLVTSPSPAKPSIQFTLQIMLPGCARYNAYCSTNPQTTHTRAGKATPGTYSTDVAQWSIAIALEGRELQLGKFAGWAFLLSTVVGRCSFCCGSLSFWFERRSLRCSKLVKNSIIWDFWVNEHLV